MTKAVAAAAEEVPVTLPDPDPARFLGKTGRRDNYNICKKCKALRGRKFSVHTYQKCMAYFFMESYVIGKVACNTNIPNGNFLQWQVV